MSMIRRHKRDPTGEKAIRRWRRKTYGAPIPDKKWRKPIDNSLRPSTSTFGAKRISIYKRDHSIPKHHRAYSHRIRGGHREMPTQPGPGPGEYRPRKPKSGMGGPGFSELSHLKGSHLDVALSLTEFVPGPGKYKIMPKPVPRNSDKPPGFDAPRFPRAPSPRAPAPDAYRPNTAYVQSRICGAPSLGAAKAPSDIEVLMKRVSILPSPGDYKVRSNLGTKGLFDRDSAVCGDTCYFFRDLIDVMSTLVLSCVWTGGALDVDSDNTLIDMVLKHASQVPGSTRALLNLFLPGFLTELQISFCQAIHC